MYLNHFIDVNVLEYLRELDASDASKGVLCVVAVFFEGNPDSKGKTPVELSQALAIQDLEDFVIVCMELDGNFSISIYFSINSVIITI